MTPLWSRQSWLRYLLGGLCATGLYFLVASDATQDLVYALLGGTAVIAILVGIRRNQPPHRRTWYLAALGNACAALGNVLWVYHKGERDNVSPGSVTANLLYLAGGLILCLAVLLLIRAYTGGERATALIDTAIIASGVGIVIGVFLLGPQLSSTTRTLLDRVIASTHPLLDMLILAAAVRLVLGFQRLSPSLWLLVVSLLLIFASDTAATILVAHGAYQTGHPLNLGWLLAYTLQGVLALHPALRDTPIPVEREANLPTGRLPVLACAALTGPVIVAIQNVRGEYANVPVIVAISAGFFLLALLRLRLLAGELHQREARFRALVQNGADGIAIVDERGIARYNSPAAIPIIGFEPAELVGTNIFARRHDRRHPYRAARARHPRRHRRLRDRLLLADLPQTATGQYAEDRPGLHRRSRHGCREYRDRRGDHHPRPHPRAPRHRRGGGDTRPGSPTPRDGVRIRARVLFLPPTASRHYHGEPHPHFALGEHPAEPAERAIKAA